jgi:hypothetical protein
MGRGAARAAALGLVLPVSCGLAVLIDECLDKLGDFFLLPARQFGRSLEDLLQSAFSRLPLWFGRCDPQQGIDTDAHSVCQLGQHFAAGRCAAQFPGQGKCQSSLLTQPQGFCFSFKRFETLVRLRVTDLIGVIVFAELASEGFGQVWRAGIMSPKAFAVAAAVLSQG